MKPRSGKSFAYAITRIQSRLTDRVCADIVHRTPSLVRKWSNPGHASLPNLEQAIALDLEFVARGLGRPPIHELYSRRLADFDGPPQTAHLDIREAALSLTGIIGELSSAACNRPTSSMSLPDELSPQSRLRILKIIERLRERIDLIDDALRVGDDASEEIPEPK